MKVEIKKEKGREKGPTRDGSGKGLTGGGRGGEEPKKYRGYSEESRKSIAGKDSAGVLKRKQRVRKDIKKVKGEVK